MSLQQPRTFRLQTLTARATTLTGDATDLSSFPIDGSVIAKLVTTAVTGTTPTLDAKLQASYDGGTTFVDVAAFAQVTGVAAGLYAIVPVNAPGAYVGAAPTASAGSVTGLPMSNIVRVVSTIGGTTPAFTGYVDLIATTQPTIS